MDRQVKDKLLDIQKQIEEVINLTPTGKARESLTDINILLLSVLAERPIDLSHMLAEASELLARSNKC